MTHVLFLPDHWSLEAENLIIGPCFPPQVTHASTFKFVTQFEHKLSLLITKAKKV